MTAMDPLSAWQLATPGGRQGADEAARRRSARIQAAVEQTLINLQQAVSLLAARGDAVALASFCLEGSRILAQGVAQAEALDRGGAR